MLSSPDDLGQKASKAAKMHATMALSRLIEVFEASRSGQICCAAVLTPAPWMPLKISFIDDGMTSDESWKISWNVDSSSSTVWCSKSAWYLVSESSAASQMVSTRSK